MPNLSIKDVPEQWAESLRQRAARNHRSPQGELMAIIEAAARDEPAATAADILAEVRRMGLNPPSESAVVIRDLRDAR